MLILCGGIDAILNRRRGKQKGKIKEGKTTWF